MQKSAFPRPGLADYGHHFAGGNLEIEVVKKIEGTAGCLISLAEAFDLDDGVLIWAGLVLRLILHPQLRVPC